MPYVTEKIAKITVNPITLRPKRFVKKQHSDAQECWLVLLCNDQQQLSHPATLRGTKCLSLQHFNNTGHLLTDICRISFAN